MTSHEDDPLKGFVPTPESLVDLMVEKLFSGANPSEHSTILDPGCGTGAFIEGILRWCSRVGSPIPQIVGVEGDRGRAREARRRFASVGSVRILQANFLLPTTEQFDYVIGNPPYVSIEALSVEERATYRTAFSTARGRFDLYLLFFEHALRSLRPKGRLVFITPEKFLYVQTASPLRSLLGQFRVEELHFVGEEAFEGLVTYPMISTVSARFPSARTHVIDRTGTATSVTLPTLPGSWLPAIRNVAQHADQTVLEDVCARISCGVATGADSVFVTRTALLTAELKPFAFPSIAGRQIQSDTNPKSLYSILVPYDRNGALLPERQLSGLGRYLGDAARREKLMARTCVIRKPWYAFHETPPMADLMQPKLLCKDIGPRPFFVLDRAGKFIPRHSVYYITLSDPSKLEELGAYLNSAEAAQWLTDHCQRAANGFVRLQSHVLKKLPVPAAIARWRTDPTGTTLKARSA